MDENKKNNFVQELTQILVKYRFLEEAEARAMQDAFAQSDKDQIEDFLLTEGLIEKEDLLKALGDFYKVPPCDVTGELFDHELICDFPKDFLLRNAIIPLEIDEDALIVVAADPATPGLEHAIRKYSENDIIFMVGLRNDIDDAVKEFYDESPTDEIPEDTDLRKEHRQEREEKELEEFGDKIIYHIEEE